MSCVKLRKVDLECCSFNAQWTMNYFVIQVDGKVVCFCARTIYLC